MAGKCIPSLLPGIRPTGKPRRPAHPGCPQPANCVTFESAACREAGILFPPDCAGREPVAQLVEQRPFKAWVLGSSPSGLTIHKNWTSVFSPTPQAVDLQ